MTTYSKEEAIVYSDELARMMGDDWVAMPMVNTGYFGGYLARAVHKNGIWYVTKEWDQYYRAEISIGKDKFISGFDFCNNSDPKKALEELFSGMRARVIQIEKSLNGQEW